jgi:hypothetical protein
MRADNSARTRAQRAGIKGATGASDGRDSEYAYDVAYTTNVCAIGAARGIRADVPHRAMMQQARNATIRYARRVR